jgi:hypothetical protein
VAFSSAAQEGLITARDAGCYRMWVESPKHGRGLRATRRAMQLLQPTDGNRGHAASVQGVIPRKPALPQCPDLRVLWAGLCHASLQIRSLAQGRGVEAAKPNLTSYVYRPVLLEGLRAGLVSTSNSPGAVERYTAGLPAAADPRGRASRIRSVLHAAKAFVSFWLCDSVGILRCFYPPSRQPQRQPSNLAARRNRMSFLSLLVYTAGDWKHG